MGVATGNTQVSTNFDVPTAIETGASELFVIANGIPSAPASVTVAAPPDFSVSVTPASETIRRGATATYTVTITAVNGFNGVVTLAVSGAPPKSNATLNPASVMGSGTSTLSVATAKKKASIGTYTLTVTGTSGSLKHIATAKLTITR
jgi:hypothetical protein